MYRLWTDRKLLRWGCSLKRCKNDQQLSRGCAPAGWYRCTILRTGLRSLCILLAERDPSSGVQGVDSFRAPVCKKATQTRGFRRRTVLPEPVRGPHLARRSLFGVFGCQHADGQADGASRAGHDPDLSGLLHYLKAVVHRAVGRNAARSTPV